MNTADFLLEQGKNDDLAIITPSKQWTYRELRAGVRLMESELLHNGVVSGTRVALLAENSLFWVATYLAILKVGAVVVPLPPGLGETALTRQEDFLQLRTICMERAGRQRRKSASYQWSGVLIWDDVLDRISVEQAAGESDAVETTDLQSDAALMLTSGSAATPRVVRISHRNIQANTISILSYLRLTKSDRMMVILPFHYCFGASLLHTHLRVGGSLVLSDQFTFPEPVLDMMEAFNCTGLAGVPAAFQTLLRRSSLPRRRLQSLHKIQQAGGKLPAPLIKELIQAAPHAEIYIMYGQTEATARLSYLPPELLETKTGSIGKGIPGVELRVLGSSGEPVLPGETGEIVASGENIAVGYLNDPSATAERFRGGQLFTGDLATVDEDGYIYIVGRRSDFIKPYGHRVGAEEIEAYFSELPEVFRVGVVGVPDPISGEAVFAFIALLPEARLSRQEILAFCKQRMPGYMVPKYLQLVDELPLSDNGKISKARLGDEALRIVADQS